MNPDTEQDAEVRRRAMQAWYRATSLVLSSGAADREVLHSALESPITEMECEGLREEIEQDMIRERTL